MKYKTNTDYIFECEVLCSGLKAQDVEKSLKKTVADMVKSDLLKFAAMSNETKNTKDSSLKIFSTIEEMQQVIGGKIIHIGRIPDSWRIQLKKEMEEKEELDKKRLMHLDDCIMIIIEGKEKNHAVILDRRGIYTISASPPK